MKISSRLDYALSCALVVADKYKSKRPVTVKEVAQREKLDYDYVERLLVILKDAGVLRSIRGVRGGYVLARHPARISAKEIIRAFEKEILELVCYRKKGRRKPCVHFGRCRVKNFWLMMRDSLEGFLARHNLEELLRLRRKEKGWKLKGG
jgi:Rrf2 family iron-sulfur cluster assembly transcriptional regulator